MSPDILLNWTSSPEGHFNDHAPAGLESACNVLFNQHIFKRWEAKKCLCDTSEIHIRVVFSG